MEKNMGKLSDAAPYLAVAALAATGVGLAGAGAAGGTIAGTTAGAGALGTAGTQTGLALGSALGTSAAVAPEAAFLASMGASSPAVAPLATEAAASTLAPHLAGGHYGTGVGYGTTGSFPEALQIGTGMEGVTSPTTPIGSHLDTSYAPIDAMTAKPNYAFGGREMESAMPQWMDLSSNISPAVEEGTKTLMEKLGIDKKTAFQFASQYYGGSMEAPPNYQTGMPTPTLRQYEYRPSTMAQIMNRNRSNTNRQIRRSTV
jgi:hypothetical protein